VNADFIFQLISEVEKREVFNALPFAYDFWEEFEFCELTENMRQRLDPTFADLLERARFGTPTQDDITLLKNQIILNDSDKDKITNAVDKYVELMTDANNLLCLFPKNDSVEKFNNCITSKLNIQTITIKAVDGHKPKKINATYLNKKAYNKQNSKKSNNTTKSNGQNSTTTSRKASQTAGLEEQTRYKHFFYFLKKIETIYKIQVATMQLLSTFTSKC
jgi:hypothetical protein